MDAEVMTSVARTLAQELPRLHEGSGGDATQLSAAAEHAVDLLHAVTRLKRFDLNAKFLSSREKQDVEAVAAWCERVDARAAAQAAAVRAAFACK